MSPKTVHEIGFHLRTRYFGQLRLRRGLPPPVVGERIERERKFYALLLARARAEFTAATKGQAEDFTQARDVFDIGCRNWSYAPALSKVFARARFHGVEVDGGRRYWNLHRRIDAAASQARELESQGQEASVIFDDFRNLDLRKITSASALFCFFYPFVSARPCRKWGLPVSFADFHSLLAHVGTSGARLNHVLSVHQGEWEAELAREAYARAGLACRETVVKPSSFIGLWPNAYDMHVLLVTDA